MANYLLKLKHITTIIFTLVIVIVSSGVIIAQDEGDTLWTTWYGYDSDDIAKHIEQTYDGGFICAGESWDENTSDFWVLRLDADGDTVWNAFYGNSTDFEEAKSVKQTPDGGFIVAGLGRTPGMVYYMFLVRTDENGDTLWTRINYGYDYTLCYDVEVAADGGFIAVGKSGEAGNDYDIYIAKFDSDGELVWNQRYGGDDHQETYDIETTLDGNYVITGLTGSCPDYDLYLIKLDEDGDSLWGYQWGEDLIERGQSVEVTSDGGYLIAGGKESTITSSLDMYFIKTDGDGQMVWEKRYGSTGMEEVYSVRETFNGNFVTAGYASPSSRDASVLLMQLNADGDSLWAYEYNESLPEFAYSVVQAYDGSYVIVGGTQSFGAGENDYYILKIAGPEMEIGSVVGFVIDMDRNPIEGVLVEVNDRYIWSGDDGYYSICDLPEGEYDIGYSHADYRDTTIANIAVVDGVDTRQDVQLDVATSIDTGDILPSAFTISQNYPNPFNATTTISYSLVKDTDVAINIYDILGKKVATLVDCYQNAGKHQITWNASEVSSGMYFYKISADGETYQKAMLLLK